MLSPEETEALRLSLDVASRSVLFSLPLAVLVAWVLTRTRFPGRTLFDAFVHLPLVLPPVAVGYVLLIEWMQHRRAQSALQTADRTP